MVINGTRQNFKDENGKISTLHTQDGTIQPDEKDFSISRSNWREKTIPRQTRVITISSGKGGVGKTNIAVNLAIALRKFRKSVMILDADLGLANVDVLLGLAPKHNLYHVFTGEKKLNEIILKGPAGILILPASSGIESMTNLNTSQKICFLDQIGTLPEDIDYFIIDTSAGISSNVIYFNISSQMNIIVLTPEPTSLTDAYALIKVLSSNYNLKNFDILFNLVKSPEEAKEVYEHLTLVTDKFLSVKLSFLGSLLFDSNLKRAVLKQKPVLIEYPDSPIVKDFLTLAKQICSFPDESFREGSLKLFWDKFFSVQQ